MLILSKHYYSFLLVDPINRALITDTNTKDWKTLINGKITPQILNRTTVSQVMNNIKAT